MQAPAALRSCAPALSLITSPQCSGRQTAHTSPWVQAQPRCRSGMPTAASRSRSCQDIPTGSAPLLGTMPSSALVSVAQASQGSRTTSAGIKIGNSNIYHNHHTYTTIITHLLTIPTLADPALLHMQVAATALSATLMCVSGSTRHVLRHCAVMTRRFVGSSGAPTACSSPLAAMTTLCASGTQRLISNTASQHIRLPSRPWPGVPSRATYWHLEAVLLIAASSSTTQPQAHC